MPHVRPARPSVRRSLASVLGLGVAAAGLQIVAAPAAQAVSPSVLISEVYGGGGFAANGTLPASTYTNDFIELYNPTDAEVDLTGWAVFYGSGSRNSGATVSLKVPLTGSIQPHGYYLVGAAGNAANGAPLPQPDASSSAVNLGSGSGLVILSNSSADITGLPTGDIKAHSRVIDAVGYGTANTFETAADGTTISGTMAAHRTGIPDTDDNAADFTVGAPGPVACGAECAAPLTVTAPGDKAGVVGTAITPFTLAASGGTTPYTWSATGLPDGLTLNPTTGQVTGTPTTAGASTVEVTATDSASPAATDTASFTYTIAAAVVVRPIAEVQGTGDRSPFAPAEGTGAGQEVTVEGVVTGVYRDPHPAVLGSDGGFDGVYIQTAGTGGASDATPGASDAIFVYGTNATANLALGESVRVTGPVVEFGGVTQISPAASGVTELASPLAPVTGLQVALPTTESAREAQEGMLLAPTNPLVVSNSYNINQYGEIGLATGDHPLVQPTEVCADSDTVCLDGIKADNAARGFTLDDGATINFLDYGTVSQDVPLPWLTKDHSVRVGAQVTLLKPVILDFRRSNPARADIPASWRLQPQTTVVGAGTDAVSFEDTRTPNLFPETLQGDVKIATFNVLNYFNTTGEQYLANGQAANTAVACTFFTDRDDNPIANNRCGTVVNGQNTGNGPRGAANQENFLRQQAKIVTAINRLGADIVGLEEIENSIKLVGETNRDDALVALVTALNGAIADPADRWRLITSPTEAVQTTAVGFQDTIRGAFIYKPAKVTPVGSSDLYLEESYNADTNLGTPAGAFANAREPLAQAFKPRGALDSQAFGVIVNHFKSKGDSDPAATGDNANSVDTGAFNGDRTRQAQKLAQFADDFAEARGIEAVFLAGDFNAYAKEDPILALAQAGYELIERAGDEESYSFGGLSGSLDHVLGNAAAREMVVGSDVWDINAAESVAYQYSRFNYNVTQLFDPTTPFAASDHNPHIVGIDLPEFGTDYTRIQLLATNDFHGRLLSSGADSAGAAVLSGAVKQLRGDFDHSVFAAAGDLIGASTFESFIQNDEPTIEALNKAGLEVSAVGNHELDQGYEDLVGRVHDHADWEYIAANLEEPEGRDEIAETWTQTFSTPGAGEIKVGFVGAVTEDLPALVSPAGIQGLTVTDIVEATNAAADDLKANQGADLVILLVHEGAADTTYATATSETNAFGHIVNHVSSDVDAIVSGHTHLAYNHAVPVQAWIEEGRAVTKRPVVSAGQYGTNLNQLVFTYDNATDELAAVSQDVVGIAAAGFPADPEVQTVVDAAKAQADVLGAVELGKIGGPFNRAKLANGSTENRGGESTLGNLVAEVQRWATPATVGGAQIAFMNPGGLRADMAGGVTGETTYPKTLTKKQAAVVQPFANTLVNMDLTGAQIKKVLEQQWQRDANGFVPSRPFLRLGVSDGFTYTYTQADDPARPGTPKGTVTGMWLNGQALDLAATYSVTVNSFLASGGDNFREFANGTSRADTGKVDLQAMVDYLAEFASDTPLAVDYGQRAVGVTFPADAPEVYEPGETVAFSVSSWTMSTAADKKDSVVKVMLGDAELGSATLDNTIGTAVYDEYGKASVSVVLPADVAEGDVTLTLVGEQTGTSVPVEVTVDDGRTAVEVEVADASAVLGEQASIPVAVRAGDVDATGTVELRKGETVIDTAELVDGVATFSVNTTALGVGTHALTVAYGGGATFESATGGLTLAVAKAAPTVAATDTTTGYSKSATVTVRVSGPVAPTGTVQVLNGTQVLGTANVSNGVASVPIPAKSLKPGSHTLVASYSGDGNLTAGTDSFTVTVGKAAPKVTVGGVTPGKIVVRKTRAVLTVNVAGEDGIAATGLVTVTGPNVFARATVVNGVAKVRLPVFRTKGPKALTVWYSGDSAVEGVMLPASVRVVRR